MKKVKEEMKVDRCPMCKKEFAESMVTITINEKKYCSSCGTYVMGALRNGYTI